MNTNVIEIALLEKSILARYPDLNGLYLAILLRLLWEELQKEGYIQGSITEIKL